LVRSGARAVPGVAEVPSMPRSSTRTLPPHLVSRRPRSCAWRNIAHLIMCARPLHPFLACRYRTVTLLPPLLCQFCIKSNARTAPPGVRRRPHAARDSAQPENLRELPTRPRADRRRNGLVPRGAELPPRHLGVDGLEPGPSAPGGGDD